MKKVWTPGLRWLCSFSLCKSISQMFRHCFISDPTISNFVVFSTLRFQCFDIPMKHCLDLSSLTTLKTHATHTTRTSHTTVTTRHTTVTTHTTLSIHTTLYRQHNGAAPLTSRLFVFCTHWKCYIHVSNFSKTEPSTVGPLLGGHLPLSGLFPKYRIFCH